MPENTPEVSPFVSSKDQAPANAGDSPHEPVLPSVSVIIPARDAEATIIPTLDAVMAQDYAGPIEVIVADGDDTPAMAEAIRQAHPDVRVIPNPERTLVPGVNAAFRIATGDVLVRCDAHTVFPTGYVRHAVETLERTGAATVGGRQYAMGTTFFERSVAIAMTTPLGAGDSRHRVGGKEGAADTVFLGTFRRRTVEEQGGYADDLVRNEDYEFNYRLRRRGRTVWFDPELAVQYRPRSTLRALTKQYFNYGRAKSSMLLKHPRSVRPRQLAAPALVLGLLTGAALAVAGFSWLAVGLLAVYAAAIVGAAAVVGVRRRDAAAVLLPLVLATMHLSWGIGFFLPNRARSPGGGAAR